MPTGAPTVLKTFSCERQRLDPNVENFLRSRKVEWILRVKVSEVA